MSGEPLNWHKNERLRKDFGGSILHLFADLPVGDPTNRNRDPKILHLLRQLEDVISTRSDELINSLTDAVKDFPTLPEIERANKVTNEIFFEGIGGNLMEKIKTIEDSLTPLQKTAVLKQSLTHLRGVARRVQEEVIALNWSELEADVADSYFVVSQIISTSISLIDSLLDSLVINPNLDVRSGLISIVYLVLRLDAFLLGKISRESLDYTLSTVQVYLYSAASYLVSS